MRQYLYDRYDIQSARLDPNTEGLGRILIDALRSLGVQGSVYHLLKAVPDQFDSCYTIMVDDRLVARFELAQQTEALPKDVEIETLEEHRKRTGQGKDRIKLDIWTKAVQKLLAQIENG